MEVTAIEDKEEKYVQVPLDQMPTAIQVLEVFARHWLKKEKVKVVESP